MGFLIRLFALPLALLFMLFILGYFGLILLIALPLVILFGTITVNGRKIK